jgi:hypothetical protein
LPCFLSPPNEAPLTLPHPHAPTPSLTNSPQFPLSDYEAELQELLALDDRTAAVALLRE